MAQPQQPPIILTSERQIRSLVRSLIQQRLDQGEPVELPVIANEATRLVLNNYDLAWIFVHRHVRDLVYTIASSFVQSTRGELILLGTNIRNRQQMIQEASKKWTTWLERANGKHVTLMAMSKQEVHRAAAYRLLTAERSLALGTLLKEVGDHLSDTEVVSDQYTEVQLETRFQQIQAQPMTLSSQDRSWAARLLGRRV